MKAVAVSLLLLCYLFLTVPAQQLSAPEDPELEKRVANLSKELRCLVCQNETLADSQAGLASDLRNQIREQMKAGKSDKEIVDFLTARYGDFVLYRPPVKPTTYLLWFGPFVLLVFGIAILFRYLKRRKTLIHEKPLTAGERKQAEDLLRGEV